MGEEKNGFFKIIEAIQKTSVNSGFRPEHMHTFTVSIPDFDAFRSRLLEYAAGLSHFAYPESGVDTARPYGSFPAMLAGLGATDVLVGSASTPPSAIDTFLHRHRDRYIFCHISYEYKDTVEPSLHSGLPLTVKFPVFSFFVPQTLVTYDEHQHMATFTGPDPEQVYREIIAGSKPSSAPPSVPRTVTPVMSKSQYFAAGSRLKQHVLRGDIYEINLCQEFNAPAVADESAALYQKLTGHNPMPFSVYYGCQGKHLLCSSPERFLKKIGDSLITQPIKGTARRHSDPETDRQNALHLKTSPKERAENVMITDLVRNDLSRICHRVTVEELCEVYTFKSVHQMISTVTGKVKEGLLFSEILAALFPAGSMTGAPKISAMHLTEKYESTARGIYSGCVGYFEPGGDFDLNVVIRSLALDTAAQTLSFHTGSALTAAASIDEEHEECMLKAGALFDTLYSTSTPQPVTKNV